MDQPQVPQTGEQSISKSQMKYLKKQEEKEKKKAEKDAQKEQQPEKEKKPSITKCYRSDEIFFVWYKNIVKQIRDLDLRYLIEQKVEQQAEEEVDPRLFHENRSKQVLGLKQTKDPNPYPHKFQVDLTIAQFREKYGPICTEKGKIHEDFVSVAGRVVTIRSMGAKLMFYDLQGEGTKIQVMANEANHKDQELNFDKIHSLIKRGDIIGVKGNPCLTKAGELSIAPGIIQLLSPTLHMLPTAHFGFKDHEQRYRMRYLDLIMNKKVRDIFLTRSSVIKQLREYFDGILDVIKFTNKQLIRFIEVETPSLNVIQGGATAKPFKTFHNSLHRDLFMRVAPELYLKMLIVGGLERVYEIGKNFRNEGIDQTHNPEFTAMEFYWAYCDYNDLMTVTEEVLSQIVLKLKGSYKFKIHKGDNPTITLTEHDIKSGHFKENEEDFIELDFTPPWPRVSMMAELEKQLGEKLPEVLESEEANAFFNEQAKKHKVECSNPRTTARLIDKLVGHFLEVNFKNPTFLIDHPQLMSPLSKVHRQYPGLTERFELFVNYHELCNAYTELNDPFVQKALFQKQVEDAAKGDDEAMGYDEGFIKSLEHALPPTAGWGLGIDRFVMLLHYFNCYFARLQIYNIQQYLYLYKSEKYQKNVQQIHKTSKRFFYFQP